MGVATTNVLDRMMASVGMLPGGVEVRFQPCTDVSWGGVLLALPALLACGHIALTIVVSPLMEILLHANSHS